MPWYVTLALELIVIVWLAALAEGLWRLYQITRWISESLRTNETLELTPEMERLWFGRPASPYIGDPPPKPPPR
jgi:hypothetical protein